MFAIAGMSFFKGKMMYCGSYANNLYLSYHDCISSGNNWQLHYLNFENILYGLKFLFILSTIEGWPDYVYWFIDADQVLCAKNNHKEFGIYFMIFLAVSAFFLMNLFTAIVSLNYTIALERINRNSLNEPQQNWFDTLRMIELWKPDFNMYFTPTGYIKRKIFFLIKSKYFENFILLVIVANAIVLASYTDTSTPFTINNLNTASLVFAFIFTIECLLKLIAFNFSYFQSNWNKFDFIVVLISIVTITDYFGNIFVGF